MLFPSWLWIVLVVSLLCCCIGFKKMVWFLSIGYGLSAAGIGLTMAVIAVVTKNVSFVYLAHCLLFVVYGVRLGGFLLMRELKNEKYRQKLAEAGGDKKIPVFVAVFMWIFCGVLYVIQSSALVYRVANGTVAANGAWAWIGLVISALGICIETVADNQKSAAKKINPDKPAMTGIYRFSRCPNYFGEIVFWTGCVISGIGAVSGWQWLFVLIGYIAIVFIMFSGCQRLEKRHIKHYGRDPEYIKYADTTPILIPFIPLYHVVKAEQEKK